MQKDIISRKDIELLIISFYEKIKNDTQMSHFFEGVNWESHLPIMYNFWENTLFYTGNYNGNPMKIHQTLHQFKHLKADDFDKWIHLFTETVDELFKGDKAELIKQRAISMATVMKIKILYPQQDNNLNIY